VVAAAETAWTIRDRYADALPPATGSRRGDPRWSRQPHRPIYQARGWRARVDRSGHRPM